MSLLKKLATGGLILALSFGCRGRGALVSDEIEGFVADEAQFAFFGFAEGADVDIDNDDTPDTQAVVTIAFTDRKTLCKDLKNLNFAENEDRIEDMMLVVVNARLVASGAERSPLAENDIIVRNELNDEVNVRFKVRAEGQTQTTAQSVDERDDGDTSNDVELHLLGVGGDRLAGTIVAPVTFFNDAIGRDDVSQISGYFAARHCRALDAFALDGGL